MSRINNLSISSGTRPIKIAIMMPEKRALLALILYTTILGFAIKAESAAIKVGIADHTVSQIALYVSKDKGYYASEDLAVDLVLMSGAVSNLALIGGNVDFTTVPTAALTAALRGAPLRILSTTFTRPVWLLYSRPEIMDIKELKGKRIGTGGFGSATDILLRELFNQHGLQAGRDLVLLSLGSTSARLNALITGSVDAAVLPIPFNFSAHEAGFRALLSFANQGFTLLTGSIVAREKTLERDSLLVDKFMRATLKGFLHVRDNRLGTIPILARNIHVKEDLATKIYDLAKPAIAEDGTVNEELQKKIIGGIAKLRGLKDVPPAEKFFDFSSVRRAATELQAVGWNPVR
jgi:ABC-type nitrate/sulfonate/bicarbonate transport system substrate-binding protein